MGDSPNDESDKIKPLLYDKGKVLEITLNPNDIHQLYKNNDDRLLAVVESFRSKLLKHLSPYATYTLVPEVSEPYEIRLDKAPRIHFHGVVCFKKPVRWLTEQAHKLGGISSIRVSPYREKYWPAYITKQKDLVAPLLGSRYYLTDKDTEITPFGKVTVDLG